MTLPSGEDTPTEETSTRPSRLSGTASRPLSGAGKTWMMSSLLLLIIGIVIARTFVVQNTKDQRDLSDLASETFDALQATKIAYSLHDPVAAAAPLPAKALPLSSGKGVRPPLPSLSNQSSQRLEEAAIRKWRDLANRHPDYASPWRKLGLTLSLFNRPGGLEAFRHIAALPDKTPVKTVAPGAVRGKRGFVERSEEQDVTLTHAQEFALWKTLYGVDPLDAKRTPELQAQVEKLRLGWFENVALAQLYNRSGQKAEGARLLAVASASAQQTSAVSYGQILFFLIGLVVLFLYGAYRLGDWIQRQQGAPVPQPQPAPIRFSYWSRGIAFIVYLTAFMVIALPLRLLRPLMLNLSDSSLLRLNVILQIVLYIPIVWITLVMLRRLAAAEAVGGARPSWRETLEGIGLFSRRPLEDVGAGVLAYTMAFPVFLSVTMLSSWIFRSYHTPINPVEVEMMVSQSRLDQALMMIQAAVAAPIVEEMMFRGLLFPALKQRWGMAMGILLSSACFALVHPNLPSGFLPLWTLGAAFALTFQRRESLLPNIVMHGLHNGFVTLTLFALFSK